MEIRRATFDDLASYAAFGRVAQTWLRSRGLAQYVPSAHDANADAIRARVISGTLFAVTDDGLPVAYFSLDSTPSPWWPADGMSAAYLAGIVVDQQARGRGVGSYIIDWCFEEATRCGCRFVRLDCHAGNFWLCGYYEAHGFVLQGRVKQYPGYEGCLYQLEVADVRGNLHTLSRRHT